MFLYVLQNTISGKFYIGTTTNIVRRLSEHNSRTQHYTGRSKGKWTLLLSRRFDRKIEARKEELRLKKAKNRKYIIWYINNSKNMGV